MPGPLTSAEQAELETLRAENSNPPKPSLEDLIHGKGIPQDLSKLPDVGQGHGEEIVNAAATSFQPPGETALLGWLGKKAGAIPDYLMQKAVGMKKVVPGVGTKLLDEGVVGTKGMMQKQIQQGIEREDANLGNAVKGLAGKIDSAPVADEVSQMSKRYSTNSGIVPQEVMPEVNKITNASMDIAGRGGVSPQDALELKRIAGRVGYDQSKPLAGLTAELAQKESAGYGKALEDAFSKQNPELPNAVTDANSKLSAFLKGRKGLNTPEAISQGSWLPDTMAAGAGAAVAGGPGAAGMVAARHLSKLPIVQSAGAQALQKGGRVAAKLGPSAALRIQPGVEDSAPQDKLSPDEEAELIQLRNELK